MPLGSAVGSPPWFPSPSSLCARQCLRALCFSASKASQSGPASPHLPVPCRAGTCLCVCPASHGYVSCVWRGEGLV